MIYVTFLSSDHIIEVKCKCTCDNGNILGGGRPPVLQAIITEKIIFFFCDLFCQFFWMLISSVGNQEYLILRKYITQL